MLRIRRIHDLVLPVDRQALEQAREILRRQFSGLDETEIARFGEDLKSPFKRRLRAILLVAEETHGRISGFAYLLHEPELGWSFLEYVASAPGRLGGGIGGGLYQRVREQALALGERAVFLECLPDDPEQGRSPQETRANAARLRFYERFGARPILGTAWETPMVVGEIGWPLLVYDGLGHDRPPERDFVRAAMRAILERKYGALCPPDYVSRVVASVPEPVELRPFRYVKPRAVKSTVRAARVETIALVVADRHDIHHVRDRGYVEAPVRIKSILEALEPTGWFERLPARRFRRQHIEAVHDRALVGYLRRACREMTEGKSLYPYVFPLRNQTRLPRERSVLAGYFCIDTFTPIHRNAYLAAKSAVDCALTAARRLRQGQRLAYALVRPPGHHAEGRSFGGFCYFNNAAVAAHALSEHGRVAILDVDYHHGNGQQEIFYRRADVLTVSIHGHPRFAYPYFSGFTDERGSGPGEGKNLNLPLPQTRNGEQYRRALRRALRAVDDFDPLFLVVALGLDPAKGDPTGTWSLGAEDFRRNGILIGELDRPTLVIQEGGYRTRTLGTNARAFFDGLLAGASRT